MAASRTTRSRPAARSRSPTGPPVSSRRPRPRIKRAIRRIIRWATPARPVRRRTRPPPRPRRSRNPVPTPPTRTAPKSEGKGDGKHGPMDDPKQATAKDGGDKSEAKDKAQPKPEGKAGSEPTAEDKKNLDDALKQLQDDLKSKDPQRREAAEEFIRRYMMNADDPKVRDAAKKTLEDAGLDPEKRPLAAPKPQDDGDQPPDAPKPPPPAEGKKGDDKDAPPAAEGDAEGRAETGRIEGRRPDAEAAADAARDGQGAARRRRLEARRGPPTERPGQAGQGGAAGAAQGTAPALQLLAARAEGRAQGRAGRLRPAEGAGERRDRTARKTSAACSTAARSTAWPATRATRTA